MAVSYTQAIVKVPHGKGWDIDHRRYVKKKVHLFMPNTRLHLARKALCSGAMINSSNVDSDNPFFLVIRRQLNEARVRPGDVVAIAELSSAETLLAAVAVWNANAVPFPIPQGASAPYCDFVVTAGPRIELAHGMPDRRGLEHTAVLHQTSGSTASPKVARRSIHSILVEATGYMHGLDLKSSDVVRIPVPTTHSFGWGVAISSVLCGCRVLLDPVRLPSLLSAEVDAGEISKLALTPPLARLITETKREGSPRLLAALCGAGIITDDLVHLFYKRFGIALTMGYGSTETGGTFIGSWGIGNPIDSIDVVAPAPGSQGELLLRLPSPALGYVGEEPPLSSEWKTGDLVERTMDGAICYISRMSGPLRVNSRFVDTEPYNSVLSTLPDIIDVVFLVLPGTERPEIEELCAAVASRSRSMEQVTDALMPLIDPNVVCRVFVFERLPRNQLGKLDRGELIRMIRGDQL